MTLNFHKKSQRDFVFHFFLKLYYSLFILFVLLFIFLSSARRCARNCVLAYRELRACLLNTSTPRQVEILGSFIKWSLELSRHFNKIGEVMLSQL